MFADLVNAYLSGVEGILDGLSKVIFTYLVGMGILWFLTLFGVSKASPFLKWALKWTFIFGIIIVGGIASGGTGAVVATLGLIFLKYVKDKFMPTTAKEAEKSA